MDQKALSTRYTFEFYDGEKCEMSLAFILLKRLAGVNKNLYKRAQPILSNGTKDEFEVLTLLYTAYVCANMDEENLMSEDDFIVKCGSDRQAIFTAVENLMGPKKQTASGKPSN